MYRMFKTIKKFNIKRIIFYLNDEFHTLDHVNTLQLIIHMVNVCQ